MPRKPPAPKRRHLPAGSVLINVIVTEEQRETLREAAKRAGLALGPWLRSLGLRESQR